MDDGMLEKMQTDPGARIVVFFREVILYVK